jgi:hypothetical protein
MDFVHDRLADGRPFRLLTLVDNFSRVSPAIECDFSLNGRRVVAVLERLKESGLPQTIKVDNVLPAKASRRSGDSLPERGDARYLPSSCYPSVSSVASIF